MVEIKPSALIMLATHCTTKLYPEPLSQKTCMDITLLSVHETHPIS